MCPCTKCWQSWCTRRGCSLRGCQGRFLNVHCMYPELSWYHWVSYHTLFLFSMSTVFVLMSCELFLEWLTGIERKKHVTKIGRGERKKERTYPKMVTWYSNGMKESMISWCNLCSRDRCRTDSRRASISRWCSACISPSSDLAAIRRVHTFLSFLVLPAFSSCKVVYLSSRSILSACNG